MALLTETQKNLLLFNPCSFAFEIYSDLLKIISVPVIFA